MHLWRYPSLSIHGIEGASNEPGAKTAIPGRVVGKFSIRLVPHMDMSVVDKQVANASSHPALSAQVPHWQGRVLISWVKGPGTNVKNPV